MRIPLFAYNATVGLEAPSVPQVVHPVGSPRVQDISMDPASFHHGHSGAQHADQNRTYQADGNAITLELSTDLATAKGKTNFQR